MREIPEKKGANVGKRDRVCNLHGLFVEGEEEHNVGLSLTQGLRRREARLIR